MTIPIDAQTPVQNPASENSSQLLTIVVLVRDTPLLLDRWLRWATANLVPFNILIADGSKDNACRDVVRPFLCGPLRVHYRQTEADSTRDIYYKKIVAALDAVQTPFVAIMADDDLPWFAGMQAALLALNANPLAISARGRIHDFECQPDPLTIRTEAVLWRFYVPDSDLSSTDPATRIQTHLTEYCLTYHDITRIDTARMIFADQCSGQILDPNLNELFLSTLLVASGPILRLNQPYLFRASRPNSTGAIFCKAIDSFDQLFQPGWMDQYHRILRRLEYLLPPAFQDQCWKQFLHHCFRRFFGPLIIRALKEDSLHSRFRVAYDGSVSPHPPSTTPPDFLHKLVMLKIEAFLRN